MRILIVDDQIAKSAETKRDFCDEYGSPKADFDFLDAFDHSSGTYSIKPVVAAMQGGKVPEPDLLLLDVNFGASGRIGYDILDWFTAQMPGIPVVMMTAEERETYLDDALSGGALDYITKPFSTEELWGLVWRYAEAGPGRTLIGQNDQTLQGVYLIERFVRGKMRTLLIQVTDTLERESLAGYVERLWSARNSTASENEGGELVLLDDLSELDRNSQLDVLRRCECILGGDGESKVVAFTSKPLSRMVRDHSLMRELYEFVTEQVVHWPDMSERLSDVPMVLRRALIEGSMDAKKIMGNGGLEKLLATGFSFSRVSIEALVEELSRQGDDADLMSAAFEVFGDIHQSEAGSTTEGAADDRPQLSEVERFLSRVASHEASYTITHDGADLIVMPGVFSPRYSHSSDFLIRTIDVPDGGSVIDLGSGTGVIGLAVLRRGASHCTFVDINPQAVENTRANLVAQGFERRGRVLLSDLFDRIEGRFDLIVTNPPFWNRKPNTMLERSCFDEDHAFIRRLLAEASDRLEAGGQLAMVLSDQSDVALVSRLICENGWRVDSLFHEVATSPSGQKPHVRIVWHLSRYD